MTQEEQGKIFGDYLAFTEDVQERGNYAGGAPLQPTATATTVRVRDGRAKTTDGPFAETREQLGGSTSSTRRISTKPWRSPARIPGARMGSVEVRPVIDFSAPHES